MEVNNYKTHNIAFIDGTVNTQVYINILMNTFVSFIDAALNADGITNILFQQDNAPPHVAKNNRVSLSNGKMCFKPWCLSTLKAHFNVLACVDEKHISMPLSSLFLCYSTLFSANGWG